MQQRVRMRLLPCDGLQHTGHAGTMVVHDTLAGMLKDTHSDTSLRDLLRIVEEHTWT